MNNFSLSVYKVTINKYSKKDFEILSDYDNGKSFLDQIDSMFVSWKEDVSPDIGSKKVSRLKMISDKVWEYHKSKTCIDGIIESGEYGTQEEIIDVRTGKSKYVKTTEDATMYPFYFMLYVEPNKREGNLIVERIGNIGIATVLDNAFRNYIGPTLKKWIYSKDKSSLCPESNENQFGKNRWR